MIKKDALLYIVITLSVLFVIAALLTTLMWQSYDPTGAPKPREHERIESSGITIPITKDGQKDTLIRAERATVEALPSAP